MLIAFIIMSAAPMIAPAHACSLYHVDIFVEAEKAIYNVGQDIIITWAPSVQNSGQIILSGPSGTYPINLNSLAGQSYDVGTAEDKDIGLWQVQIIVNDPTPGCGPIGSASNSFRVVGITTTASLVSLNVVGHSPSSDRASQSSTTNNVNGVMYASWAGGSTQANFGDIMAVPTNTEITFSVGSIQAGFSFSNKWDCYSSAYNDDDNRNWQDSSSALYTFDSQSGCPVIAFFDTSSSTPPQNSTVAVTAVGHSPSSDRGSSPSTNNNVNGVMYASWAGGSAQINFGGTMQIPTDTDITFTVGNIQSGYSFDNKWDFWYCYSSVDSNKNNWRTDTASAQYNFAPQSSCNVIAFFDFNSQPLEASAECSPASGNVPLDVSCSVAPMGGVPPYTYAWSFTDGGTSNSQEATHEYQSPGDYGVQIVVSDSAGSSIAKYLTIHVTQTAIQVNVQIHVVDVNTGAPIPGAQVYIGADLACTTDSQGNCPISMTTTSNKIDVNVHADMYQPIDLPTPIDLINGGTFTVKMIPYPEQSIPRYANFDGGKLEWYNPVIPGGLPLHVTVYNELQLYGDSPFPVSYQGSSPHSCKFWYFFSTDCFSSNEGTQSVHENQPYDYAIDVDPSTPPGTYKLDLQVCPLTICSSVTVTVIVVSGTKIVQTITPNQFSMSSQYLRATTPKFVAVCRQVTQERGNGFSNSSVSPPEN